MKSLKNFQEKYFKTCIHMCVIKEAFTKKTINFGFFISFYKIFLKETYMLYISYPWNCVLLVLNTPSSSSLLAVSVKYSAKCKHGYVCLCATSRLIKASASWMQNRQGTAVCLTGASDVSVYKSWSQAGATTGGVLSASLLHLAFVWAWVKERTTSLHVQ